MKNRKCWKGLAAGLTLSLFGGSLAMPVTAVAAAAPEEVPVIVVEETVIGEAVIAEEIEAAEISSVEEIEAAEIPSVEEIEVVEIPSEEVIEGTDPADAAGESFDTAIPISSGSNTSVSFSKMGERRYYQITTPADGYINFSVSHPLLRVTGSAWYMSLYKTKSIGSVAAGGYGVQGSASSGTSGNIGLAQGTYYLVIGPNGDATFNVPLTFRYDFYSAANWEKEENGFVNTANVISLNTLYKGNHGETEYDDFFQFTLPQKGYVTVEFSHAKTDKNLRINLGGEYLSTAGIRKFSSFINLTDLVHPGESSPNSVSGPIGLAAGTYLLKVGVTVLESGATDYSFKINYTADPDSGWEVEPNGAISGATVVSADKTIYGSVYGAGSNYGYDYYAFELKNQTTVNVTLDYSLKAGNNLTVMIYDKDRKQVQTKSVPGRKGSFTTEPVTLGAGLNFICIQDYIMGGDASGTYTLRINTGKNALKAYGEWRKAKNGKWWYRYGDGSYPKSKWLQISGKWYYFDKSGYMVTGWKKINKKWYYFGGKKDGAMKTGWVKSGGKWYYMDKKSGAMTTGWLKSDGKWYYLDGKGRMVSNTSRKIGKKTYRFNKSGVCTNP